MDNNHPEKKLPRIEIIFTNGKRKTLSYEQLNPMGPDLIVQTVSLEAGSRLHFFPKMNIREFIIPGNMQIMTKIRRP